MAGFWEDNEYITVRKIENGYLLNGTRYFKTKKKLIKYVTKLLEELE